MTTKVKSLILIFLLISANQQQDIGFAQPPNPDVIKCGKYFLYIQVSSPTQTHYAAATGTLIPQGYQVINGVLKNKQGNQIPTNCQNQTIESLWMSNRAFRLFNQDLSSNKSIEDSFPDVVKCGDDIVFFNYLMKGRNYGYTNPVGMGMIKQRATSAGGEFNGLDCGGKSLNQLKTDGQSFNIFSERVATFKASSIYSMTENYPDLLVCNAGYLAYIYSLSAEQIVYRAFTSGGLDQLTFSLDGNFKTPVQSGLGKCIGKTLTQLIAENRAYFLNTPVITCPSSFTSQNPVVEFKISVTPGFTTVSIPASKTHFPYGQTTTVKVNASHGSGVNLSCSFDVTIGPDTVAPALTCPQDIKQKDPLVIFEASATDNDPTSQLKITYDKAPNTQFPTGETTIVKATTSDDSGNQAMCTFKVQIVSQIMRCNSLQEEVPSQSSKLGIIVGAVVAGLAGIISVAVIVLCKKHKVACFKKKARLTRVKLKNKVCPQDIQSQAKIDVPETEERFNQ